MIDILYKSENVVVISKPYGMGSEPDQSGADDAMSETSRMLRSLGENDRLWLVHRLDRVVGGVMLLARSANAASEISKIISERQLAKEYIAVIEGIPKEGEYSDFLWKDARINKAVVCNGEKKGAKIAKLTVRAIDTKETENGQYSLVHVTLHTGRFHQIRAQLSNAGTPILGDGKYGSRNKKCRGVALYSAHISIKLWDELIDIVSMPSASEYPWNLFVLDERKIMK